MKLTKKQRLARLKEACETVEDELNRLVIPGREDLGGRLEALAIADNMREVIRHLKARWGELNAELNGGTDAER